MTALSITTVALMCVGLVFLLGASVGMLRLPDVYSRSHAAGMCDSLGAPLCFLALAIYYLGQGQGPVTWYEITVSIKILLVGLFLLVSSPTSAHALFRGAYLTGQKPWTRSVAAPPAAPAAGEARP